MKRQKRLWNQWIQKEFPVVAEHQRCFIHPLAHLPIKSPLLMNILSACSLLSQQTMLEIKENRRNITNNISASICAIQSGLLEHLSLQGRGRYINLNKTDFRCFNYKFDDSTWTRIYEKNHHQHYHRRILHTSFD